MYKNPDEHTININTYEFIVTSSVTTYQKTPHCNNIRNEQQKKIDT